MFLTLAILCGADPTFIVENKCPPSFTVTNRCPVVVKAEPVRTGYPLRGNLWTHPGEIHAHLMSGEHRGKWPAEWVRGLTNSEAEALHSDDHEGRVKWQYVPGHVQTKPAPAFEVPSAPKSRTVYAPTYCPPGASH